MSNSKIDTKQGHWILAKMGKKVLRPGERELTNELIKNLKIDSQDSIVEFAPGLGHTAALALQNKPKSYTGVELNEEAADILRKTFKADNQKIIVGNASNSTLEDSSASKTYGEAMLTMQSEPKKSEIIKEAYRILQKGGLYGIHELGLKPDDLDPAIKAEIQKALAHTIKVNARPLTAAEWSEIMEKEGFKVKKVVTNGFKLLEPKRMIADEGFFRTLKIMFNILTHPRARKRILGMRKVFKKYREHLFAVAVIAEK